MRHVGDRMIISPPLIINEEQIDILMIAPFNLRRSHGHS